MYEKSFSLQLASELNIAKKFFLSLVWSKKNFTNGRFLFLYPSYSHISFWNSWILFNVFNDILVVFIIRIILNWYKHFEFEGTYLILNLLQFNLSLVFLILCSQTLQNLITENAQGFNAFLIRFKLKVNEVLNQQ